MPDYEAAFEAIAWEDGERPNGWTSEDVVWLFKLSDKTTFFTSDLEEAYDRLLGEAHLRDPGELRLALFSMKRVQDQWNPLGNSQVLSQPKKLWDFTSSFSARTEQLLAWAEEAKALVEVELAQVGERFAQHLGPLDGKDIPQAARHFFDQEISGYTRKPTNGRIAVRKYRQIARKYKAYELEALCQRIINEEDEPKKERAAEREETKRRREVEKERDRFISYLSAADFEPRHAAEQHAVLLYLHARNAEEAEAARLMQELKDFVESDVLTYRPEKVDVGQTINELNDLLT